MHLLHSLIGMVLIGTVCAVWLDVLAHQPADHLLLIVAFASGMLAQAFRNWWEQEK